MLVEFDTSASPTIGRFLLADDAFKWRHKAIMGPFGSGKSTACLMGIIKVATIIQRPQRDGVRRSRWLVVRDSNRELRDSTIKTVKEWFPPAKFGQFRESEPHDYFITELPDCEIEINFRSLENPSDVKKLLSAEYTGAWLNEYRTISREIFDGVDGRIGRYPAVKDGGCTWCGIFMDTNPPSYKSFYYDYFEKLDDVKDKALLLKQPSGLSEQAENIPYLQKDYYKNLAAGKEEWYIKVFIEGEYGYSRDGKPVHLNYSDTFHVADNKLEIIPGAPVILSFDFGLTPACVVIQEDTFGRILVVKEFATKDMPISQLLETLLAPYAKQHLNRNPIIVTGDPAGNQRSQADANTCYNEIQRIFFNAKLKPFFTNDSLTRHNALSKALRQTVKGKGRLLLSPDCTMLREGLSSEFKYPKINVLNRDEYREVPVKNIYSHSCEALEYGVGHIDNTEMKREKYDHGFNKIQKPPDINACM